MLHRQRTEGVLERADTAIGVVTICINIRRRNVFRGSNPGRSKRFSSPKRPYEPMGLTQPLLQWVSGFFRVESGRGLFLSTHIHLVPMLEMNGAVPPIPQ